MIRKNNNKNSLFQPTVNFVNRYRWQILIFIGLVIVASVFFPRGKSLKFTYQKDDIARETVIAPFTFPILKPAEKLQQDIDEALKSEPALFIRSQEIVDTQVQKINSLFSLIDEIRTTQNKLIQSANKVFRLRYEGGYQDAVSDFNADSLQLIELKKVISEEYSFDQDNEIWKSMLWDMGSKKFQYPLDKLKSDINQICRDHWSVGIYDIPLAEISSEEVLISQADVPELVNPNDYNDLEMAWTKARIEVNNVSTDDNQVLRDIGYEIIVKLMLPNLIYDKETTERRRGIKLNRVPRYRGAVLENERIIEKNTRITDDNILKLRSLEAAMGKEDGFAGWWQYILEYLGKFIIIAVVLSFFFTFLIVYRKDTFLEKRLVLLISILFA